MKSVDMISVDSELSECPFTPLKITLYYEIGIISMYHPDMGHQMVKSCKTHISTQGTNHHEIEPSVYRYGR